MRSKGKSCMRKEKGKCGNNGEGENDEREKRVELKRREKREWGVDKGRVGGNKHGGNGG